MLTQRTQNIPLLLSPSLRNNLQALLWRLRQSFRHSSARRHSLLRRKAFVTHSYAALPWLIPLNTPRLSMPNAWPSQWSSGLCLQCIPSKEISLFLQAWMRFDVHSHRRSNAKWTSYRTQITVQKGENSSSLKPNDFHCNVKCFTLNKTMCSAALRHEILIKTEHKSPQKLHNLHCSEYN